MRRTWKVSVPLVAVGLLAAAIPLGGQPMSSTDSDDPHRARGEVNARDANNVNDVNAGNDDAGREDAAARSSRSSRSRPNTGLELPPIPSDVSELRTAARQARDRLSTATQTWKAAGRKLTLTRARQRNMAERARQTAMVAGEARTDLGEIAADSYRQPGSGLALVMDGDRVRAFLRDSSTLEAVTRIQGQRVSRLVQAQVAAKRLANQAQGLSAQVDADADALRERRKALADYADSVDGHLDRALARLERKRLRENPLYGVPGCNPRAGYQDYPNGLVPSDALCPLPQDGHFLRADAAVAFARLNDAYKRAFGEEICVTDSYRSLGAQQSLYAAKPGLAAVPGTSNHGDGVAVDLCDGVESYYSAEHQWLDAHGDTYGWDIPGWARDGGGREEPWHWEFSD